MSTVIVNHQNTDITAQFIFGVPANHQRDAMQRLLGAISPYVPTTELEKAIKTVDYGLRLEHATVTGERVPDTGTGQFDCVANLPGEGRK